MNKNSGFTLIETIVVLTLLGVISIGLGAYYINTVNSFNANKTAVQIEQDSQFALARIAKELNLLSALKSASGATLSFNPSTDTGRSSSDIYTFTLKNDELALVVNNDKSYAILKNVDSFTVSKVSPNIVMLSIQLTINGISKTFQTSVALR
ncbi:PulJ/GspJ family protein [Solidesulfovibrio alcoholivorans]|uniref:PulJ/GspJ family protein n=1 Tax=Solidesulfovibrio alcoholivorans TaxID=81406 RepID=UPI000A051670|nr:type II secretion system protein [Solidesulfovibrio alcoholivorans]